MRRGVILTAMPGSDLIVYPGPFALIVRSDGPGNPASDQVAVYGRPFPLALLER